MAGRQQHACEVLQPALGAISLGGPVPGGLGAETAADLEPVRLRPDESPDTVPLTRDQGDATKIAGGKELLMRLALAAMVSLLLLQLSGSFCRAEDPSPTGASEGTGSLGVDWNRAMELGEAELSQGNYAEALRHFLAADEMDFPEVPNYEALPKIAEARCHLGDRTTGRAIVADLRCILDVNSGATPCYVGEETRGAPGHPNPALTPVCFERLCGEIFLAYYESPSEAQLEKIHQLRRELDPVAEICGTDPES